MSKRKDIDASAVESYIEYRQLADDAKYCRKALDDLRERVWKRNPKTRTNEDVGPKVPEGSWERGVLERQVLRFVLAHGFVPDKHYLRRMEEIAKGYRPALKGATLEQCGIPAHERVAA